MSEDEIWDSIRGVLKSSNCLKTQLSAGIVKDGKIISVGFNLCAPNQHKYGEVLYDCPRMGVKTGTSYELCSGIHAEVMACLNIRPHRDSGEMGRFAAYKTVSYEEIRSAFTAKELDALAGSKLYLAGHYWICDSCSNFLKAVGIKDAVFDGITGERTRQSYLDKKLG